MGSHPDLYPGNLTRIHEPAWFNTDIYISIVYTNVHFPSKQSNYIISFKSQNWRSKVIKGCHRVKADFFWTFQPGMRIRIRLDLGVFPGSDPGQLHQDPLPSFDQFRIYTHMYHIGFICKKKLWGKLIRSQLGRIWIRIIFEGRIRIQVFLKGQIQVRVNFIRVRNPVFNHADMSSNISNVYTLRYIL